MWLVLLLAPAQASGISRVPTQAWAWPATEDLVYMGSSAAIGDFDGDGLGDLVVGAGLVDLVDLPNAGRVDVFYNSGDGFAAIADQTLVGDVIGLLMGTELAAGDVNGDGIDDLAVLTATGGVRVYYGSAAGLVIGATLPGASPLASAGDVNGDGVGDLLVGDGVDGVTLWLGAAAGPTASIRFADPAESATGGVDVDGDGLDDVILGDASAGENLGAVRVYRGSTSALGTAPWSTVTGTVARVGFGKVGAVGDVDGDGFADVAVAATADSVGADASGTVFVYGGSAAGLGSVPIAAYNGAYDGANLGWVMAGPADYDADGLGDLTLGSRGGREVYVYPGSASGLPVDPSDTVPYGASGVGAALGLAVGDANDDGCDDLLVGGPGATGGSATLYAGNCPDLDGDGIPGPRDCDDEDPDVAACGVELKGGCGCASAAPSGPWALLVLALLARRQSRV